MKIFSLPLNPKLSQSQFDDYVGFLHQYKDYIYDIYFTSRIAPFNQDAMGDVFIMEEESNRSAIDAALFIQRTTGIPVSATFNNIHVPSTQKNLDKFIKNFKPLYDAGIRSATIPHTQWVLTGKIQAEFPELLIKNTILRDTNKANQVYSEAKAGFHYVNLDRDLMRDRDELIKIMKVKKQFPNLKISLLVNEGCAGACPIMNEHYQYNCTRTKDDPQYFTSPISRISCSKWDAEDPAIMLKTANLPPWKEEWDELLELGIDTFKMHGRENIDRLAESMRIIMRFSKNEPILVEGFDEYLQDTNLIDKPINAWRKIIKNCKFDCWDCNYCDKVYESKSSLKQSDKVLKLVDVLAFHDNKKYEEINIEGLTSHRMQNFITELGNISENYLEVGSYLGSTGVAALRSNIKTATFVDHWKENIQPMNGKLLENTSKDKFIENIRKHKRDRQLKVFDSDLFSVDLTEISDIDLFFYDGPHDAVSTARAIQYYASVLADEAILVFDDANFEGVVEGANLGIQRTGLQVMYDKIWLNDVESDTEWWNGFYVVVVKRK
jgi:predicted O-methyltransferase YrrM